MHSERNDDGESVNVVDLFDKIRKGLAQLIADGYAVRWRQAAP